MRPRAGPTFAPRRRCDQGRGLVASLSLPGADPTIRAVGTSRRRDNPEQSDWDKAGGERPVRPRPGQDTPIWARGATPSSVRSPQWEGPALSPIDSPMARPQTEVRNPRGPAGGSVGVAAF